MRYPATSYVLHSPMLGQTEPLTVDTLSAYSRKNGSRPHDGGKGKGKSGGVRVIYYFDSEAFPVFLLTVYAKNQKANLTKAEPNKLQALVPLLVKNYRKGRQK